ncbi:hypothetical protein, partial [Nonomuraea rhizosphaerae]|uniref:hypothetical protein n=1 Tax=Nonomuraea rhizosphaerae TaxID=2665663 RepID=UPI001C5DA352
RANTAEQRPAAPAAASPTSQVPREAESKSAADSTMRDADSPTQDYALKASPAPSASARATAPGREFPGENEAKGYYAHVAAFAADGMTQLSVRVTGVPVGTTCGLVVYGKGGERESTPTWVVNRETYRDMAVFPRQTYIPLSQIARFEIVDAAGKVLVKIPVPKRK